MAFVDLWKGAWGACDDCGAPREVKQGTKDHYVFCSADPYHVGGQLSFESAYRRGYFAAEEERKVALRGIGLPEKVCLLGPYAFANWLLKELVHNWPSYWQNLKDITEGYEWQMSDNYWCQLQAPSFKESIAEAQAEKWGVTPDQALVRIWPREELSIEDSEYERLRRETEDMKLGEA